MLWLFILACGEKESDSADVTIESTPATFTQIQTEVFALSCSFSSCHGAAAGGLLLNGDGDYERLLNVNSIFADGQVLVSPNDVENSYLVKKVSQTQGISGDIMPPGSGLSAEAVEMITSWIEAGAEDN